jgi:hypothetical protein
MPLLSRTETLAWGLICGSGIAAGVFYALRMGWL